MAEALTDEELTALRALLAAAESNENVNTVLDLPVAGTLTAQDILYILQGSGTNRDKKVTLGAVRSFLQNLSELTVNGEANFIGQGGSVKIDNGGVNISFPEGLGYGEIKLNADGLYIDGALISEDGYFQSGVPALFTNCALQVGGQLNVEGTKLLVRHILDVKGKADIGGDLSVEGAANVTGNATVNGDVTANSVTTNGVQVNGNEAVDGTMAVSQTLSVGQAANFGGVVTFNTATKQKYFSFSGSSSSFNDTLVSNSTYTSMPIGSIVYAYNQGASASYVAVEAGSSPASVLIKEKCACGFMKISATRWAPLDANPTVTQGW